MRKWIYEIIVVFVLVVVGLGIWWFVSTKNTRALEAQYEQLIKIANRQAVEIAIIQQAAELNRLKKTLQQSASSSPVIVQPPEIADPKDVKIK